MMQDRDEARATILDRVGYWAVKLRVRPRFVRIQRMSRKWGSCSSSGIVTFASDLAERDQRFVDFVVAHELMHLRVPNHGKLFRSLMALHVPEWRQMDVRR